MENKPEHPQLTLHPLLLVVLAVLLTLLLGRLAPLPFIDELPSRVLGGVLFAGGLLFGFPAFRAFVKARTTLNPLRPSNSLVESGTFRMTRNPMYLGMIIAYAGLFIYLRNAWFIPAIPVLIWLLTIGVIVPEERYLHQRFGDAYARFAARVPRWI